MKPVLLALAVATMTVGLSAQSHFWIDATNGDDTNPGTRTQPFKTLEKGLLISSANAVIHIMPGTYGPLSTGDFWDAATATEKDIILRDYQNVKIVGEDRDTCIIDFDGKGTKFWGFISVRGAATDGLEITNLTFQNIVPGSWGSHWGCGAVIINGGAGKTNIHGCHYIDANAAWINWGSGTDNAFHHNIVRRTVPGARAHAVRIRHAPGAGANTYVYNNTFVNQQGAIGLAGGANYDPAGQYVVNNVIIDGENGMSGDPAAAIAAGSVLENNNVYNNTSNYVTAGWPTSNISVDPQFVDPANADFRLKPASPLVDGGYDGFLEYQVNDYFGGASAVDKDQNGKAEPDVGAHELTDVEMILTNWVQGGTPAVSWTSADPTYALGFFALGFPNTSGLYKADPFGTIAIDTSLLLMTTLTAIPTGPTWNPLGTPIPVLPALNDFSLYAQGFAYTTVGGFDVFQPTGLKTITL